MTIRLQRKNMSDRLLSKIGKKRAVFIPPGASERHGIYMAIKEPFFRALFRTRNRKPSEGWFYPDLIMSRWKGGEACLNLEWMR
ncbi:MAG: hypothetical protein C4576_13715 [Desulfobacteraceae bacterium]|nr:MAG: hypothetical protein C4576_13715 [Desulfobacteraceae bacterium]